MSSIDDFLKSLAFVVVSPDSNVAMLRDSVRSLRSVFGDDAEVVCCVSKNLKKDQFDEMNSVCPTFRGGETITSLINEGFKRVKKEGWRLFIMEGARVQRSLGSRYARWIKNDRDVLFPIVINQDREGRPIKILANFEDSTLNGMLIHSKLFDEVGSFSDNPIPVSKSFWAMGALERGGVFKAILGVKII